MFTECRWPDQRSSNRHEWGSKHRQRGRSARQAFLVTRQATHPLQEKRNRRQAQVAAACRNTQSTGPRGLGRFQGLLRLAQHHHRRAALAEAMPKHAEAGSIRRPRETARKTSAEAVRSASLHVVLSSGQGNQKFILARPSQQVVAAQMRRSASPPGKEARRRHPRRARIPVAEVVDIEKRQADSALAALRAVGLAEERSERFAVVNAGQVRLRVGAGWHRAKIPPRAPGAGCEKPGPGVIANTRAPRHEESGSPRLGKPVDRLLGHSVGNHDDRKARAFGLAAGRGQQLPIPCRAIPRHQGQWARAADRGQRGLCRKNDLDARACSGAKRRPRWQLAVQCPAMRVKR